MGVATTGAPVNLTTTDSNSATVDGAIRIYAQSGSSAAHGAFLKNNGTLTTWNSGTGRQDIHVLSANAVATTGYVFECSGPFTVKSAAVADAIPAIRFTVQQTNSASTIRPMMQNDVDTKFIANGGGDLELNITTLSTSNKIAFGNGYRLYFLATSGEIRGNFGGGLGLGLATAAKPMVIGSDLSSEVPSSSSNITIGIETFVDSSADSSAIVRTSGSVKIQPPGAVGTYPGSQSFSAALTFDSTWLFTGITGTNSGNIGSVTIGQSGTGGTVSGLTQNSANITLSTAITSSGSVAIYGGTVTANANVTVSGSNSILFKATQDVICSAGVTGTRKVYTSADGPITLWSNADASGTGAINVENFVEFLTANGNITMAGGSTATETSPTGYAQGNGSNGSGVELASSAAATDAVRLVSSGSGAIFIKGQVNNQSSYDGVTFWSGVKVTSGTGTIGIFGHSYQPTGANTSEGVYLNRTGGYTSTISTGSTASPAIEISGLVTSAASSASTASSGVSVMGTSGAQNITATAAGAISITGTASSGTTNSIELNYTNVTSAGGTITIDGGTKTIELGYATGVAGTTFGGPSSSSLSGNVKLIADKLSVHASTSLTFQNAAGVYIEPKSPSFGALQAINSITNFTNISYLGLGKDGNTAAITFSAPATTVKGNIDIWGGAVTVNNALTTTTAGNITVVGSGAYTGSGALNASGAVSVRASAFTGTGALTSAGVGGRRPNHRRGYDS
jgi:filamentous hemagglutinin